MIDYKRSFFLFGIFVLAWAWWPRTQPPTTLSFQIGATIEEVASDSTYPVFARSNHPKDDPGETKAGATWVTEPAVIIRFNDPRHGFTLPPTKFAVLTYMDGRAETLATSPMLDSLSFDETVLVLANLQKQFKAGGWEPWEVDQSNWFDLTPAGKKQLYQRMFQPGYAETAILRIPDKYSMIFRLKCIEGCWTKQPPYRFLIDIGLSDDVFGRSQITKNTGQ